MFACPACQVRLVRTPIDDGIIWNCERCHGRAATVSLLRKRVSHEAVNSIWRRAQEAGESATRNDRCCPSCGNPMTIIAGAEGAEGAEGLELDACRACQFFWFDAGEAEQLPARPEEEPEPPLHPRAREALAMAEVEAMANRQSAVDSEPPEEIWQVAATLAGLPVEENAPMLRRKPFVTWGLAALVAVVSLNTIFEDLSLAVENYGLIPSEWDRRGGITLLTSFFLHGGLVHFFGNLYFLLIFGDNVEDYLGHLRYAALLLLATFAGDAAHILVDPASTIPLIGASGGISGIIVFYALAFPRARIRLLFRFGTFARWQSIRAWTALGLWLALQLFWAWEQVRGFGNVSALAHLGGAGAGLLFWLAQRLMESAEPEKR